MRMLRLWLNEPVLDCVANQGCIVRQSQLLEDPPAVGADRARAEKHLRGDLVDMLARRYQPHHPVFAIGEQVVRRLLSALGEIGSQLLREGRAYILTATDNLADGAGQVFVGASLVDEPGAAGLEYLARVRFLGQDTQHQDGAPGILSLDFSHQVDAAAAGGQDTLAHTKEPERLGAASYLGVNAAAIVLDSEH